MSENSAAPPTQTVYIPNLTLELDAEVHTDDSPELEGCEVVWGIEQREFPTICVIINQSLHSDPYETLAIFSQIVYEYWMESPDCDEPLD